MTKANLVIALLIALLLFFTPYLIITGLVDHPNQILVGHHFTVQPTSWYQIELWGIGQVRLQGINGSATSGWGVAINGVAVETHIHPHLSGVEKPSVRVFDTITDLPATITAGGGYIRVTSHLPVFYMSRVDLTTPLVVVGTIIAVVFLLVLLSFYSVKKVSRA